ncbi:MAG TPA: hypothetical protein VEZ17_11090 [Chitinophagaceae bacterium]|nr:hypothetical protein [Chitinophagaceae bacterium]
MQETIMLFGVPIFRTTTMIRTVGFAYITIRNLVKKNDCFHGVHPSHQLHGA